MIYPGTSKEVVYTYDELSRIKTVTTWTNHVATYNYNEDGTLKSVENFNGITANYNYDKASRLEFLDVQKTDGTSIARYQYGLDGNGNREEVTKTEPLIVNPSTASIDLTYNAQKNRLLSAGTDIFAYDDEGQLATKTGISYTFDYEHRLTGIGATTQFSYNAAGTRLKAVRNSVTTKYIYDAAGNLLAEADENDVITRYYVYGAGLLAMITPAGDVYSYQYDGGGNTVAITDQSQAVVNSYSYTPFGIITSETENITNPFKFAGQYGIMYEGDDIYYMKARYYDASVGRFISEDPSGMVDGPNLYLYVHNNPIMYVDPLGLCAEKKWFASGFAYNFSWVNPFTSRMGGVSGFNRMTNWLKNETFDYYYGSFDRGGSGLDFGAGMESVWAYGSGSWEGDFDSINLSLGPFVGSYFWSPDGSWKGVTFGLGAGLPGAAYEGTNYRKTGQ